jgi:Fe2+ transport system protein FeoA
MTELEEGDEGTLVNVTNDDSSLLQHLDSIHLTLGSSLKVLMKSEFDGSLTIETRSGKAFISKEVSEFLRISKS